MKHIRMKFLFALCCILVFPFVINAPHLRATETMTKVQVLELTDSWTKTNMFQMPTTTPTNLNMIDSRFETTRMTIKEFNASRFRLQGRFDAIVIGSSPFSEDKYSKKKLTLQTQGNANQKLAHNTSLIENDLSKLKFNELKKILGNTFIVMHDDTKNGGILEDLYNESVITKVSSMEKAKVEIEKKAFDRPRLISTSVSQGDTELNGLSFTKYAVKNEPIKFKLESKNLTATTIARLYIDLNSDDRFTDDEMQNPNQEGLVWNPSVTSFTGPRNWLVELVDAQTNKSDYQTGSFLYKDQLAKAQILQVTENSSTPQSQITKFMSEGELLGKKDFYEFNVKNIKGTDFDKYTANLTSLLYKEFNPNGVSTLGEAYDLLVLGFKDVYKNSTFVNENSFQKINEYIGAGQGVLMTHDTIFRDSTNKTNWETYFSDHAGQLPTQQTDLGKGAPLPSTKAALVNKGILTSYPYKIDMKVATNTDKKVINIRKTHNQYFQLDLNAENLTPYYNMYSEATDKVTEGRTIGDAMNHYYIYSKGNVTYSGSGHSDLNVDTPTDEKQLFSNTMYRAFIASNHKPEIRWSLKDDEIVLNSREFSTTWQVLDYDLSDTKLKTTITLYNGPTELSEKLASYSTVVDNDGKSIVTPSTDLFKELFKGKTGKYLVKIEASDRVGQPANKVANAVEKRIINVIDDPNPIKIKRSLNDYKTLLVGEKQFIDYQITLPTINNAVLSDVTLKMFQEQVPTGLKIVSLEGQKEIEVVKNSDSDYQISFKPISYKRVNGEYQPELTEIKWRVGVEAVKEGEYRLNRPVLSGTWSGDKILQAIDLRFEELPNLSYKQPKVTVGPYPTFYEGNTVNLFDKLHYSPTDRSVEFKNTRFEIVGPNSIAQLKGNQLIASSAGIVRVRAVSEVFGKETYSEPTDIVFISIPTITKKETAFVGQKKDILIDIAGMTVKSNSSSDQGIIFGTDRFSVQPSKKGETIVEFILENAKNELQRIRYQIDSRFAFIGVGNPVSINQGERVERVIKFFTDETLQAEVILNAPPQLTFKSMTDALEILNEKNLAFVGKTGTPNNDGRIRVSYESSQDDYATLPVYVTEFPSLIQAKDMVLKINEIKAPLITWNTPTVTETNYRLDVISGKPFVKVESDSNGVEKDKYKITGLSKGLAKIKLTALTKTGSVLLKEDKEISSTFFVLVEEGSSEDKGDRY